MQQRPLLGKKSYGINTIDPTLIGSTNPPTLLWITDSSLLSKSAAVLYTATRFVSPHQDFNKPTWKLRQHRELWAASAGDPFVTQAPQKVMTDFCIAHLWKHFTGHYLCQGIWKCDLCGAHKWDDASQSDSVAKMPLNADFWFLLNQVCGKKSFNLWFIMFNILLNDVHAINKSKAFD